jgi:hypothetical protein
MILEEAYTTNPKPDKQARFDIVQRVSMTEKEVQVRNRRCLQLAVFAARNASWTYKT